MSEELKKIIRQNEIIIFLLGRIAFDKEEIGRIVTFKKRNPREIYRGV